MRLEEMTESQAEALLQLAPEEAYENAKALDTYSDTRSLVAAICARDAEYAAMVESRQW